MLNRFLPQFCTLGGIVFFIYQPVFAQPPDTLWTKVFQVGVAAYGNSVQQTADEGFIVAGKSFKDFTTDSDIYLIKTDANGETLWTKTIGDSLAQVGNCIQQTSDGGYIIAGFTGTPAGSRNAYIVKTDSSGDTLWTTRYGGDENAEAYYVKMTSNSGYIATGIRYVSGQGKCVSPEAL